MMGRENERLDISEDRIIEELGRRLVIRLIFGTFILLCILVVLFIISNHAQASVELTPPSQSDNGEPGDAIDFIIKISNEGNTQDTFDLTLQGSYVYWGEVLNYAGSPISNVRLNASNQPGWFVNLILRVTIPGAGETTGGQTYPIILKATSETTQGVEDSAQVLITVDDYVDLKLEYTGGEIPRKDYDPNRQLPKFSFGVTNYGNQDETGIYVRVDDIEDDWNYTPEMLAETLAPGYTLTFSIEFIIPSEESEGEYNMQVYVVSSIDPTVESDFIFTTVNITKPDLRVSSFDISGLEDINYLRSRVGNSITITATIHNDGHSRAESVQVRLFENNLIRGTATIFSIDPGSSEDVNFRWIVVAEDVEIRVTITLIEEIDEGNNAIPPIFLDLAPNLSFVGDELNFSDSNPEPGERIEISAIILNSGGDAEDVVVRFYEGTRTIGTDTLDIDYEEVGIATIEWEVPDRGDESILIRAEIEFSGAQGDGVQTTRTISVGEEDIFSGGMFSSLGLITLILGFILGAIIFLILGIAIGSSSRKEEGRETGGKVGPGFVTMKIIEEEEPKLKSLPPPPPDMQEQSIPPLIPPPPPPPLEETFELDMKEEK